MWTHEPKLKKSFKPLYWDVNPTNLGKKKVFTSVLGCEPTNLGLKKKVLPLYWDVNPWI